MTFAVGAKVSVYRGAIHAGDSYASIKSMKCKGSDIKILNLTLMHPPQFKGIWLMIV